MAYKFQLGPSRLSGSLNVIGDLTSSVSGAGVLSNISASGDLRGRGLRLPAMTGSSTFGSNTVDLIMHTFKTSGDVQGITPSDFGTVLAGTTANSGLAASSGVLTLDIANLAEATIASGDEIVINDATGDVNRRESIDDVAAKFAGAGLAAASAVMTLDISEYSEITPAASDAFLTLDSDNSTEQLTTTDALATKFAGAGLAAASAVMSLDISEYSEVTPAASDAFLTLDSDNETEQLTTTDALATKFAGSGLAAASAVMSLDISEYSAVVPVGADSFLTLDSDGTTEQLTTMTALGTAMAGAGLDSATGVLEVGAGTLIDVAADSISVDLSEATGNDIVDSDFLVFLDGGTSGTAAKCDTSVFADLLGGDGLAVSNTTLAVVNATNGGLAVNPNDMQVDFFDLTAKGATLVTGDSLAIVDSENSDESRKVSMTNLGAFLAGTGITNTAGKLSVDTSGGDSMSSTAAIDNTVLTAGLNYFTGTIDPSLEFIEVVLPSGDSNEPTEGDIFYLKAPSNCGTGNRVNIEVSGAHGIDGETSIVLEDSYATVGFVYAASASWVII